MLLTAPNGELWCIWSCHAPDREVHGMWLSRRRPGAQVWDHRRIFPKERLDIEYALYPQLNPWVLSSGRIIAPFIARMGPAKEQVGVFLYTDDDGATWHMSNGIRGAQLEGKRTIWEIHGSEQTDGTIRVFGRAWGNKETVLLTATGTGIAKGSPLKFEEEARFAGVQGYQNRPFVMPLAGGRYCLLFPDSYADADTLPARPASLYFSRWGRNDYVAGPSLSPVGAPCNYPQGIEHEGAIYIAFTDEFRDGGRNMTGVKVSPSPDPDRFYIWPRRRDLGPYVSTELPEAAEVDGRTCVSFRGLGTAGVDTMPTDLSKGGRLEVRLEVKVGAADARGECVLLSFGDTMPGGALPVRIGGPSLASGKLSISTSKDWQEVADFALGAWHSVSLEIFASHALLRVDTQAPRRFEARTGEMNPRLYLGEGAIVGDIKPDAHFAFAVDLASFRTTLVRTGDTKTP